jgi:Arc/MetJ-type ribon-helix-helix transcriptional regulator
MMKIITINLPEKYLQAIQILNEMGAYPSRSEAIRTALRDFLAKELKMYNDLDDDSFKMLIRSKKSKIGH